MRIVRGLDFMNVVKCERDVKILIRSRKKWRIRRSIMRLRRVELSGG